MLKHFRRMKNEEWRMKKTHTSYFIIHTSRLKGAL